MNTIKLQDGYHKANQSPATLETSDTASYTDEAFESLGQQLNRLEAVTQELAHRLRPVLSNLPTSPEGESKSDGYSGSSDIVNKIHSSKYRVSSLASDVSDLIRYLEI